MRTAIALADDGGIQSLSMRKLARELGVEAMSLYHHVKNKEDLIDGMVDVVFEEMDPPSVDAPCKSAMRERVQSARRVFSRHPWAIMLMEARTSPGVATLRHHDTVVRCLREAGFSMPMVGHAMSLVDSYVRGFAIREAQIVEREQLATAQDQFEFGLRLILDALEAAARSRPAGQ